MPRIFASLTIAVFAFSGPLSARTLLTGNVMDESEVTTGIRGNIAPPECTKEASQVAGESEATGGIPDTEATAAAAEVKACCWVFMYNRWWCMQC